MKTCKVKLRDETYYGTSHRPSPEVQIITGNKVTASIHNGWLQIAIGDVNESFTPTVKIVAFPASRVLEYSLE